MSISGIPSGKSSQRNIPVTPTRASRLPSKVPPESPDSETSSNASSSTAFDFVGHIHIEAWDLDRTLIETVQKRNGVVYDEADKKLDIQSLDENEQRKVNLMADGERLNLPLKKNLAVFLQRLANFYNPIPNTPLVMPIIVSSGAYTHVDDVIKFVLGLDIDHHFSRRDLETHELDKQGMFCDEGKMQKKRDELLPVNADGSLVADDARQVPLVISCSDTTARIRGHLFAYPYTTDNPNEPDPRQQAFERTTSLKPLDSLNAIIDLRKTYETEVPAENRNAGEFIERVKQHVLKNPDLQHETLKLNPPFCDPALNPANEFKPSAESFMAACLEALKTGVFHPDDIEAIALVDDQKNNQFWIPNVLQGLRYTYNKNIPASFYHINTEDPDRFKKPAQGYRVRMRDIVNRNTSFQNQYLKPTAVGAS